MLLGIFAAAASAQDPANDSNTPGHNVEQTLPIVTEPAVENANKTGSGADSSTPVNGTTAEVIKNVKGHKTHGEYQNNTNSCASCHQTHTSKGKQLLFADTTYQTCAACHDGTLGFYNVFETGDQASLDGAGTFGGTHGMSIHQSNDSVKIKAAPGGAKTTGDKEGTGWNATFSCASCHAPHGSYSDRLLHYNPNGMATRATEGGKQLQNLKVVTTNPANDANGNATYGLKLVDDTEDLPGVTGTKAKKVYLYLGDKKQEVPMLYGYNGHGNPHFTHLAYKEAVKVDGIVQKDATGKVIWKQIQEDVKSGGSQVWVATNGTESTTWTEGAVKKTKDKLFQQELNGMLIWEVTTSGELVTKKDNKFYYYVETAPYIGAEYPVVALVSSPFKMSFPFCVNALKYPFSLLK